VAKTEELAELYREYEAEFRGEEIVLGDGNEDSFLLLVGEAPGKDEVRLGKPFVGAAGKNLAEFLELLGIGRESVYITNAIKHRLSRVNGKTGRIVNRPATVEEINKNRRYLLKEVDIIKPRYIVTLGNVALRAITGDQGMSVGQVHGRINNVNVLGREYNLYPLYHPASIIYNRSLKDVYTEDVVRLKQILNSFAAGEN